MRMFTTGALCSLSLAVSMSAAAPVWSQEKVGVATTVIGPVTVVRASMPPGPLKFKDDILLRDRVTTGDNAITRILLGGKVIVTARERSTLTITEVPGLSTIDLPSGRIAVAVDKTRMKKGERVEIRTPNAIAGVRGTVLIVEAERDTSTITVLRGLVDVVRIDPRTGLAVGAVTPVGKQEAVTVRNNVLPSRPQTITPTRAEALSQEFTPPVRQVAAAVVMSVEDEVERAKRLLNALLPPEKEKEADRTTSGSMNAEAEATPRPGGPIDSTIVATPTIAPVPTTTPVTTTLATGTGTLSSTTSNLTNTTTNLVTGATTLLTNTTSTLVPTTTTLTNTTLPPTTPTSSSTSLLGGLLQPVSGLLK